MKKFDSRNVVIIEPELKKYDGRYLKADNRANYGMALSTHLPDVGDFTASIVKHGNDGEAAVKIPAAKIARELCQ